MNHSGPWSWRSTRQGKPVLSDDERAYVDRVKASKQKRLNGESKRRKRTERNAIRQRNNQPIF